MIKSILITGANAGLGKDAARQFALRDETELIYLACRNPKKAQTAKAELEKLTGRRIFKTLIVDVSDLGSVNALIDQIEDPIDALILNAGGMGLNPFKKSPLGVINIFGLNVLGHAVLTEELLRRGKVNEVVMYAGSEAARGVSRMGMSPPKLESNSVQEFTSIIDGTFFKKEDLMQAYAYVKYMAALWMSSIARKYPKVKILTVSPGGTGGTEIMEDMPQPMRFMFEKIGNRLMPLFGLMHDLDVGAKRYVDAVTEPQFESGVFYGSKKPIVTGPLIDQAEISPDLKNQNYQDNAYEAIHSFLD